VGKTEARWHLAIAYQPVPTSENSRQSQKTELARAIANGKPVSEWALENHVPRRTAYRWARDPRVEAAVESCRRRALDQAIGRMSNNVTWAVDRIVDLARDASSESVKLAALKAILSNMMSVSEFAALEERMTQIEGQLKNGTGNTTRKG